MLCPVCHSENAATTRFCTNCGSVQFENTRMGSRRRILRPGGLRQRFAPVSGVAETGPAAISSRLRRVDLVLAAVVVLTMVMAVALLPRVRPAAAATAAKSEALVQAPVPLPLPPSRHESRMSLTAPALVEPAAEAHPASAASKKPGAVGAGARPQRASTETAAPGQGVTAPVAETPEIVALGPAAAAAAPPPAPVERDRWQDLRTALAGCGSLGLLERATCEQGARIAHCDRYWGLVPQCPVGRTDYGN